jgi:dynein heavy chain 2
MLDEKIQIVVSMLPPSSIGRNQLTQRFTAIVKIINIDYPSNEDLNLIYSEYFRSLLKSKKMDENLGKVFSAFFIDIYLGIKKGFSVDEYRHYSFTPKSLFKIYRNLTMYELSDQESLLEALSNEIYKNYRNKIVGQDKKNKFDQMYQTYVKNHFRTNIKADILFSAVSGGKLMKVKKEDYLTILKSVLIQY